MLYLQKPANFYEKMEVVGCFLEHDGKILLLHRQDHKPEGNTRGMPAGKVDSEENIEASIIREVKEETGYHLQSFSYFQKTYAKLTNYDVVFHIFHSRIQKTPNISINPKEHKDYQWVTPIQALEMNLIEDLDACIKLFYNIN